MMHKDLCIDSNSRLGACGSRPHELHPTCVQQSRTYDVLYQIRQVRGA